LDYNLRPFGAFFMKYFLIIFILFVFSSVLVDAQELQTSPLNFEFLKYREELLKNEKQKKEIIPAPFKYYFSDGINTSENFPLYFNLKDSGFVSPVKDQGSCGCCWAFATLGSLESSVMMRNSGVFDFSEENMKNCHGFLMSGCSSGNHHVSVAYLTRGSGPALESQEPYIPSDNLCTAHFQPQFLVTKSYDLPKDPLVIKNAIMENGGVYATIYWQQNFYNFTYKTYYYTGTNEVNHAVLVTGWDDNKVISGKTGAWIAKNSWGTGWGQNGYFYISYFDTKFLSAACVFPEFSAFKNGQTVYLHDTLGMVGSLGYGGNTAYGLVKLTAKETHSLTKVGTFINAQNTKISVEIYSGKNDESLVNRLAEINEQTCPYPGYYTFDLPVKVPINKGEDFYVKIKYITPGYNFPVPCEYKIADYSDPHISENTSWVSSSALYWERMGAPINGKMKDVCIRAYAEIDSSSTFNGLNIYPNPNQGIFTLEFDTKQEELISVELYDITGKIVYKRAFVKNLGQIIQRFNFSKLPKGVYIFSLKTSTTSIKRQLLIL